MSEDFDINTVVSGVVESRIDGFFDAIVGAGKSLTETLKLSWKSAFCSYIKGIAERHSRARSFFHRAEPEYLYNFYVPLGVKAKHRQLPSADAKSLFGITPHVVIQGSGGCGKSVLTRHLLLDVLRIKAKIPILVELRMLNQDPLPLLKVISNSLKECGLDIGPDVVLQGVQKGQFAILFDGFDELNAELRARVSSEIRSLAIASKKSWILITSRPDELFSGWSEFSIYEALPLTLDKAISLVELTPINNELRGRFLKDLQQHLFSKHRSFLSNPLLLSIMLLTYQDAADIPKKLSVFYSQAFEALFQRHDAWKGGYKRQRKCDFDIHDFGRLFSAFSIVAYDKRLFSFSSADAISFVKKAAELTKLSANAACFLSDCTQAVCLLVQDGLLVTYSHRSFQEYFAAKFIADSPPVLKLKLLERYGKNLAVDKVMDLLHEMQPEFVEADFVLKELNLFFDIVKIKSEKISRITHLRYVQHAFKEITFSKDHNITVFPNDSMRVSNLLWYVERNCSYLIGSELVYAEKAKKQKIFSDDLCENGKNFSVSTEKLTVRHPVARFLFDNGVGIGAEILSRAWKISREISKRAKSAERSLDQILAVSKHE